MQIKKRKMLVNIYNDKTDAGQVLAQQIRMLIIDRQRQDKTCLIGITAGRSPQVILNELKRMHNLGRLSFYNVHIVLTDEFFPCAKDSFSYLRFLDSTFLSKIDIPEGNVISPCGLTSLVEAEQYCHDMPQLIKKLGGIDISLLGIGEQGVIGFNEPGTSLSASTRLLHLNHFVHPELQALSSKLERLPERAISLGMRTLLKSRKIHLLAWGEKKAKAIYDAIESPVNPSSPASYLQFHNNVTASLDKESAQLLVEDLTPSSSVRHQTDLVPV